MPFVEQDAHTKSLLFSGCELQSRMRIEAPDALDVAYTRTMMGFLLFKGQPRSIAMIGLGGGSLAKFCHRHLPDARITVVEINPLVIALRDEFLVPRDDARFRVIEGDGAEFVAQTDDAHDVLLVDGFDDAGMPDSLATQAFYDHCHQMLSPDGLMVVNLHDEHPAYAVFLGRIERSFGANVLRVRVEREGNTVVFASKASLRAQLRQGVTRHTRSPDTPAWNELKPTFAHVLTALRHE